MIPFISDTLMTGRILGGNRISQLKIIYIRKVPAPIMAETYDILLNDIPRGFLQIIQTNAGVIPLPPKLFPQSPFITTFHIFIH
jgi:hypothetical protein